MQHHLADYFAFYAQDIETKPFFDHDFKTHRLKLSGLYQACKSRSWVDWFTWRCVSIDLWCKQHLSTWMHSWFHQEQNIAPSTTDILVRFDTEGHTQPEEASTSFERTLHARSIELSAEDDIHLVNQDVFVKETNPDKNYTSVYARITAPRFMDFRLAVKALAEHHIYIRKIAGQDHIQVKCEVTTADKKEIKEIKEIRQIRPLYSYHDGIHANRAFCLFDVPVKNLHTALDALEGPSNPDTQSTIKFIHNF
jgi:hypothetical protein